jgi:hypothetical protein
MDLAINAGCPHTGTRDAVTNLSILYKISMVIAEMLNE